MIPKTQYSLFISVFCRNIKIHYKIFFDNKNVEIQVGVPGVARVSKNIQHFFAYITYYGYHGFSQKIESIWSNHLASYIKHIYKYICS